MPTIPSLPRLSIIVPVGNDTLAFEDTLISVLENQPAGSEILVAHDGSYDDPFDLEGVVRFVTTDRSSRPQLIASACEQARGRFLHVIVPGLIASANWADTALDQFEKPETAAVAPVVHRPEGEIAAAGWTDGKLLCQPVAAGRSALDRHCAGQVIAPYLQASFWRREVLSGLMSAFQTVSMLEASYAFGQMLIAGHWRCNVASESRVLMEKRLLLSGLSSYRRGQRLWAIKKTIDPQTPNNSWAGLIGALLQPSRLPETCGQVKGPAALSEFEGHIEMSRVPCHSDHGVVAFPMPATPSVSRRQAA